MSWRTATYVGNRIQVHKRRLSPSDKKYQQAFSSVLEAAFDVPGSSPDWAADLLAKLDHACLGTADDPDPIGPRS